MLALLAVATVLLPQGAGPTLAGRVLASDGAPVAAATVTLLHRPIARHLDPEREHRVVVTSDARGAFRATLREDATYSAWAASDKAASQVAEGVAGGDFVEFRLEASAGPRAVAVAGLDAWHDAATFTYRALVGGENFDLVVVPCRDGQLRLPPLPPLDPRTIEVLAGGGRVLWAGRAEPDADGFTLLLPPPATYEVAVTDAAGAPLADVEILAHILNYWATQSPGIVFGDRFCALWPSQGKTDANGRLSLRVAGRTDGQVKQWLLARKDGFAMSLDGVNAGKMFRAGTDLPADAQPAADAPIRVVLRPAPPQVLSLKQPNGTALAVDTLFVVTRVYVSSDRGGRHGTPFAVAIPVAGGEAVLRSPLPAGTAVEIAWTTLSPALRDALREQLGFAPSPQFRLPQPQGLLDPPELQFDAAQWHAVHVITADGRPAARTVVRVQPPQGEKGPGLLLRTDRLGRVAFERRAQVGVCVFARAGAGHATIAANTKAPTTLALRAVHAAAARLVDGDGAPVANGTVTATLQATANDHDGFGGDYQLLTGLLPSAPSDAEGRCELLLPPFMARCQLAASAPARKLHATSTLDWDPGGKPVPIEIVVDAK